MSRKRPFETALTLNVFGPKVPPVASEPPKFRNLSSSIAKVLNDQKLLSNIFEFLDVKTQSKCRGVCRRWRSVLTLSLRSRIKTLTKPNVWVNVGPAADIINCRGGAVKFVGVKASKSLQTEEGAGTAAAVPANFEYLLVQDAFTLMIDPVTKWRQVRRMPWFVATLLELDWLSGVQKLVLDRCMTVDDWNAASNAILAKFPGLTELQLLLPEGRNYILPLVYADLQKKPKVPLRSLKKVQVTYNIRYFENMAKCSGAKSTVTSFAAAAAAAQQQLQRYGGLEREVWWSGVRWDFLIHCWNLEEFQACIAYGDPHVMGRYDFVNYNYNSVKVTAKKLSPEVASAEHRSSWKALVSDRFCEWSSDFSDLNPRPTGPAAEYRTVLIHEIVNILNVIQPTDLQLPIQAALISAIPSSIKAKVEVLSFGNVEAKPEEVIFGLRAMAVFPNVKKLNWIPFCCASESGASGSSQNQESSSATITSLSPLAPNLVTVMLNDSNAWMEGNLWKMAPNVQLVISTYLVGTTGISDVFRAVRQALTFGRLKHLVLLAEEKVDFLKSPSSGPDMAVVCSELNQLKYLWLEGLESLTLIAKLPVDLVQLTKTCVELCSSVRTIRKLGVYKLDLASAQPNQHHQLQLTAGAEIDVSRLGVPVPGHLITRAGSTNLLGTGEAKFDGVAKSYVKWEELCCLPRFDQPMEGIRFMF